MASPTPSSDSPLGTASAGRIAPREDTGKRDTLARIRTSLANERTLLAYIRTALALLLSGASILQFLHGPVAAGAGSLLILAGVGCFGIGLGRFRKSTRQIAVVESPGSA